MKKTLFFLSFLLSTNIVFSQGNGNTISSIQDCPKRVVSIAIHVVLDSLGNRNIMDPSIQSAIDTANKYFAPICTEFKICTTLIHPNVRSSELKVFQNRDEELAILYNIKNVVNLYFVESIEGGIHPMNHGQFGDTSVFAHTPLRDALFYSKSGVLSGLNSFMRQLGHYFGLYTTDHASFGQELVNQSNCTTAGDKICDTYADPGPGQLDFECHLTTPITDTNGDYYTPPTCNIMSLHEAFCSREFTVGQYNRMLEVMAKGRNYLW